MHWLAGRSFRVALAGAVAVAGIVAWGLPPPARVFDPAAVPAAEGYAAAPLRGAFHVHSRWSDGSGTVQEIAAAADAAGLDFVILTDHGDGTAARPPAYVRGVLMVHGVEIGTDGGHYVALGLPAAPYPLGGDARGVVEDVRRLGGFGVVAHPASPRAALAWSDWSLRVDGIEWLNLDSAWRDDSLAGLLRAAAGYWFRAPESLTSLLSRPNRALERWDTLAARRPVVAFGATDAHARLGLGSGEEGREGGVELRFPGYEATFRTVAIRVEPDRRPTGDAAVDAETLVDGLRAGRVHTAIDALGHPVRFSYAGRTAAGKTVRMGERADPGEALTLHVAVAAPSDTTIRLLRAGRTVAQETGSRLAHPVPADDGPAAYRVEVTLPDTPGRPPVPWIVSNPIYVGVAAEEPAAPAGDVGTALPAPGGSWQVERRPDASATLTASGGGFRMAFGLGDGIGTYVAAARTLPAGALADAGALLVDVEASRPMRVSLQIRQPAHQGDLAPRWRRSFYADPERRVVRAAIEEFAPAWSGFPARPALAAADGLLVVVDTVNAAPGASGVLTVHDLLVEPRAGR